MWEASSPMERRQFGREYVRSGNGFTADRTFQISDATLRLAILARDGRAQRLTNRARKLGDGFLHRPRGLANVLGQIVHRLSHPAWELPNGLAAAVTRQKAVHGG